MARLATSLTAANTTALLTALAANSAVLVAEGANDVYKTLGSLLHAIPPRFAAPTNKWMASRATIAKIKDQRASTAGLPFFEADTMQLWGHDFVVNDNLTGGQVIYGDWGNGAIIRRTPVFVRIFQERFAAQDEIGFRVMRWSQPHFLCETSAPNQPLFYTTLS